MRSMDRIVSQHGGAAVDGVLTVTCPTIACLMMALMAYGTRAVSPTSPAFQLVVDGFIVGVLAFASRRWQLAGLCTAAILLTVGMLAFASHASMRIAAHTIILMAALTGIAFVSMRLPARRSRSSRLLTFLTWAGVSAVFYFLAGVILLILFRAPDVASYLRLYARLSVALGLGLGLGFVIRDRLEPVVSGKIMRSESSRKRRGDYR